MLQIALKGAVLRQGEHIDADIVADHGIKLLQRGGIEGSTLVCDRNGQPLRSAIAVIAARSASAEGPALPGLCQPARDSRSACASHPVMIALAR